MFCRELKAYALVFENALEVENVIATNVGDDVEFVQTVGA